MEDNEKHNLLVKESLQKYGFPYHTAPREAGAEQAMLHQAEFVDVVLSEDMDTIMFGCNRSISHLCSSVHVVIVYHPSHCHTIFLLFLWLSPWCKVPIQIQGDVRSSMRSATKHFEDGIALHLISIESNLWFALTSTLGEHDLGCSSCSIYKMSFVHWEVSKFSDFHMYSYRVSLNLCNRIRDFFSRIIYRNL